MRNLGAEFAEFTEGGDCNGSTIGSTIALTFAVQSQLYCSTIGTLLYQHCSTIGNHIRIVLALLGRNGSTIGSAIGSTITPKLSPMPDDAP